MLKIECFPFWKELDKTLGPAEIYAGATPPKKLAHCSGWINPITGESFSYNKNTKSWEASKGAENER